MVASGVRLAVCGFGVRSHRFDKTNCTNADFFYQGWLDYGAQDGLTEAERLRSYNDGDALPNSWHPSDHIPVAVVSAWK